MIADISIPPSQTLLTISMLPSKSLSPACPSFPPNFCRERSTSLPLYSGTAHTFLNQLGVRFFLSNGLKHFVEITISPMAYEVIIVVVSHCPAASGISDGTGQVLLPHLCSWNVSFVGFCWFFWQFLCRLLSSSSPSSFFNSILSQNIPPWWPDPLFWL